MRATELGKAVGYGEGLVYKVEAGKRIPRPEFLAKVDEVLRARGKITAMAEDLEKARYPKKLRDLAKLEAQAVQLEAYGNHNLHGLLQTREYAQALFETRQPALTQDEVERQVSARTARKSIFDRPPAPALSFVQEETTLRRPIGGRMVLRRQLEHLLALTRLRNVSIQVMPTSREENAGMVGLIQVLRFRDGTALGRCDGEFNGRPVSDPGRDMSLKPSTGDGSELEWFKSSYSDSSAPNDCVEIAPTPHTIHVRDSKNPQGPQLAFPNPSWADFLTYATSPAHRA